MRSFGIGVWHLGERLGINVVGATEVPRDTTDDTRTATFERLIAAARAGDGTIDTTECPYPVHQLLTHLVDRHGLLLHGSNHTALEVLEPQPARDLDTTLLAVLPRDISSIPVIESTEGETDALSDPVLPRIATAAVAVVAVDTTTSDLVYAIVVRLRPDVFTDDAYRDWRDSYDEGACGGVSNVVGHAQSTIGGNSVYIATCANGLRTYHAKLETRSILISASSTGDRRFGILLLGNLRT